MAFPPLARDGLAPHDVARLYLFWTNRPDTWVDVTGTLDRKIDALLAHASQIDDPDGLRRRIEDWAAEEGAVVGVGAAEAFRLIVIDEDTPADGV
jgi:LmbE family N-acetylglucosaminyl deacetylase